MAGKVTYAADVFFASNSHDLPPLGKAKLDDLYDKLQRSGLAVEVIIAVGHADSVGSEDDNQRLSQARADATKAYLASKGIGANLIYAEGKGESQPVADNKTAEGRWKNNRVEVELVLRPQNGASTPEVKEPRDLIPVLFATNRKRTGSDNPFYFYGNEIVEEADRDNLRRGVATIRIPKSRAPGTVSRPHWVKVTISRLSESPLAAAMGITPRPPADTQTEFSYARPIEELSTPDFSKELAAAVAHSTSKTAVLYIHGYANDFTDAAFRTAQIVVDLERPGYNLVPIMFSWPSDPGTFNMNYDLARRRSRESGYDLARFLEELAKATEIGTVHLIAHSMGADVLGHALLKLGAADLLAAGVPPNKKPQFRQIVFAAPDITPRIFADVIEPALRSDHRITAYGTATDLPLWLSAIKNQQERMGSVRATDWLPNCVDTIDVTRVSSKGLRHSTWAEVPRVLDDLRLVLQFGLEPAQRGLEKRRMANRKIWTLPLAPPERIEHAPSASAAERLRCDSASSKGTAVLQ
jgi:esterase/lipase superfamily enzyme